MSEFDFPRVCPHGITETADVRCMACQGEAVASGLGAYDRQGRPITYEEYASRKYLDDEDYKRVAATKVGPYWISTVWLGLDHGFGFGPPLIFETMVFADVEPYGLDLDLDQRRYATEAEALAGHEEYVTLLRATTAEVEAPSDEAADHE